jgi:hypothetical protein
MHLPGSCSVACHGDQEAYIYDQPEIRWIFLVGVTADAVISSVLHGLVCIT